MKKIISVMLALVCVVTAACFAAPVYAAENITPSGIAYSDIRDYLPEGFLTKLKYPEEKITMKNLMSHNAGFQESFYENQECGRDALYDSLEQAVMACECRQAYHVGEHTAYSNWGTALAAYISQEGTSSKARAASCSIWADLCRLSKRKTAATR